MGPASLSRRQAALVIGIPIAWGVLLVFHPGGDGTRIYADLDGDGTRMLVVHLGTMLFIPLIALAIALLLEGLGSTAARVSRIALIVFVVFYLAWEALQGIANGVLVDQVTALPRADRGLGADLVQQFAESPLVRDLGVLASIGSIALIVAAIAPGIALRDAGAPRWTPWVLGLSGLLITAHPPPFGPTGLLLFVLSAIVLLRARPAAPAAAGEVATDPAATRPAAFSRWERVLLVGVPAAWAIVLLFHPTGGGEDFYPIVRAEVTPWLVVHLATMVFVPMMAAIVFLLLRDVDGVAAAVSRVAVAVFAVVYLAWEVLIGIGTGVLVDQVNQLGPAERPVGAQLVEGFTDSGVLRALELVGTGAWIVALAACGVALVRGRGAPVAVLVLLALAALPTAWHVAPFGQVGLALFIAAVAIAVRGRSPTQLPAAPARPAPV
jgi:hypothetical protein